MMFETKRFNRSVQFIATCSLVLLFWVSSSAFYSPGKNPAREVGAEIMQLREQVTGWAQTFTGLRYRYAGQSPKTGFDCSGFTRYILKEFNINVSSSSSTQSRQGKRISLNDVLPGDLVFFGGKGYIQHVALVVENTAEGIICVHSTCSRGIVVENISTSRYWKPRILFARDVISDQAPLFADSQL
ncbi:MAG: C40 family peptidase [Saprospiraceae bacterium]|nr:C40 family peptidase [Saprospiraceae bacterium]MCC6411761.1 C40 family peptidase [Saprospiraceae bacterium]